MLIASCLRGDNCGPVRIPNLAIARCWELVVSVGCDEGACSLKIWTFNELGFFGDQIASLSRTYASNLPWRQALMLAHGGFRTKHFPIENRPTRE